MNDANFPGGALSSNWNIVVTDSTFSSNTSGYGGGAISTSGTVDAIDSEFSGNDAATDSGGAITANGGTSTRSTFTDNSAGLSGGGVYFTGPTTITDSTFSGNTAGNFGGGATIYGLASISGSTFSSNTAQVAGGGVYYASNTDVLAVSATTIADNTVTNGNGGGMQVESGVHLVNSTITGNRASGTSGAIHAYSWYDPQYPQYATQPYNITLDFVTVSGNGAAIAGNFGTSSPQVVTLIANASVISDPRTDTGAVGGDNCVLSPAATATASVASDASCFADGGMNRVATVAAIALGPVADNGGATATMLPGSTSVLLEFVTTNPVGSVTTDQRGVARTVPMTAGAVEVDPAVTPTTSSDAPVVPAFTG